MREKNLSSFCVRIRPIQLNQIQDNFLIPNHRMCARARARAGYVAQKLVSSHSDVCVSLFLALALALRVFLLFFKFI